MLRDEIYRIVFTSVDTTHGHINAYVVADLILALPELQLWRRLATQNDEEFLAMAEKAKKWDAWPEYIGDAVRSRGWLHKDDHIEGLEVVEKCHAEDVPQGLIDACPQCHGTGEIVRPLTVGEGIKLLSDNITLSKITNWTLPSGGRVRVKR